MIPNARPLLHLLAISVAWPAVPATAQVAAPGTAQVYGLTDAQKADVLGSVGTAPIDGALRQPLGGSVDRQVHGKMGVTVGTAGARSIGGTAAIPLGQNGGAIISFENSRFGNRRYW